MMPAPASAYPGLTKGERREKHRKHRHMRQHSVDLKRIMGLWVERAKQLRNKKGVT